MIRFDRIAPKALAAAAAAMLAGCAAKPPPVAVAPAQPATPARPMPPHGAVVSMAIPPVDASGVRQTVNANLTPAQMTWNLRSALNVAALNCLQPSHAPILEAYKGLLKNHAKGLAATSRTIDREYRERYGATFLAQRDAYNTQVYNYFALPPARAAFCDAALAVSNEMLQTPTYDLDTIAAQSLPRLEQAFEGFFRSYEQFRADAAAWDAKYGQYFGYTLPQSTVPQSAPVAPVGAGASDQPVTPAGATVEGG